MTDEGGPGSDNHESGPDPEQNPFRGTPLEGLFGADGQMPDLASVFSQMQSQMSAMFAPHDGPLNWDYTLDVARKQVAGAPDPSPSQRQQDAVADAVRLADHWLDDATGFASGVKSTAAWSRAEWVVGTTEVWKVLVEPVVRQLIAAMGSALPEEARAMAGPMLGMLQKAAGMMVATQVGQALGELAGEVVTASDIGLPLGPAGKAALLPANVTAFADGLDVEESDVLLYFALREAAHQRLFAQVPWLRDHLIQAVADYAAGIEIDTAGIEEQMRGIDPSNPASFQEAMSQGMFEPKQTPAQEAALGRLEVTLALVEGWIDEVVGLATAERMPAAAKMAEAVRRRRATGGPAEQTFASLVGLELRPRRLRDAATLWSSLRARQGIEARDGVWMSAALLPSAADLDDPLGFREDASAPSELSTEEFDAELQNLLEGGLGDAGDVPTQE